MINDLKDLQKLFKLCRNQGILEFKMNGVEIKFGDMPEKLSTSSQSILEDEEKSWNNFPSGPLTPEQLMFYSAGGKPEDDPENKEAL